MTEALGLWAYGVLDGHVAGSSTPPGVDPAHEVELIRHAGLAVLVSPVPLDAFGERPLHEALVDIDRLEILARVHNEVLREALQQGTVVPFRICTIFESATGVKEMLARQRSRLTAALERLQGRAEWGVKAYTVGGAGHGAEASEPASGTDYLRRKLADRNAVAIAQQALDTMVEALHARLRELSADAVLNATQPRELSAPTKEMVLNAAYLVADEDADGFGALVTDLARRHHSDGLELELTGPWPAYNFSEPVEP